VRPGITGWAQINGRNQATWDQRLADDIWYVKNRNTLLDIKIIYKTISKVLSRDGAIPDANLVMEDLDVIRKK
jgi:lipopolysaccharide/colanic/teichoic acid biosynthesis glycosyltransferase